MTTTKTSTNLGRVLVVGGNGFLGHHIVRKLQTEWTTAQITSVDLRCVRNRFDGVEYHEVDITDGGALMGVFKAARPDVVIHTASPAAQGADAVAHDMFRRVNVDGTHNVVQACQAVGVKALVFTSSASIISDNVSDLRNADERWPVIRGEQQSEYYSETKAAAEELVLLANRAEPANLLTCSIRPAGIFGEGDTMVLKRMIEIYHNGKTNVQVGDNNNLFDFTYVGNVAHAHLLAAQLLLATAAAGTAPLDYERVDGEAFMLTNDEPCYFWDFARAIWVYAGSTRGTEHVWTLPTGIGYGLGFAAEVVASMLGKSPTFTRQRIIYSSMTRYYNITKAKTVLRYKPQVSLEEGIRRGVKWFQQQEAVKA